MSPADSDDEKQIAALRQALRVCAAAGATVTYRELAQRVTFPGPHSIHRLTLLLEEMIRQDHAAQRPLLAALAVSRAQNGVPGRGFFQLLGELGRYTGPDQGPEAAACHAVLRDEAIAYWRSGGDLKL